MKKGIFLLSIVYLLFAQSVSAATFRIGGTQNQVSVGEEVLVNIGIDTENARLNLFNVTLKLPDDIEFVDFDSANSIISVWVRSPVFDPKTRTISLIGGVPGGALGRVVLTSIKIRPRLPGTYHFLVAEDSEAYLNDGLGTKSEVRTESWALEVQGRPGKSYAVLALIAAVVVIVIIWLILRRK